VLRQESSVRTDIYAKGDGAAIVALSACSDLSRAPGRWGS